jgi:transposase-like protein
VITGEAPSCRSFHLSTNFSTPKPVNPISIWCGGKSGHSRAPGVKAATSVHGVRTTYQPGLQRYRCQEQECRRTFNDLTGTLLEGSKRSVMDWMLATVLWCLSCASHRIARELGVHVRTGDRWWWWRHAALSDAMNRQLAGTVEADDLYHTAGHNGQAKTGGKKSLGRQPRSRRKKREPGRGHYDQDRPAIIAGVSRQGGVMIQATRDFTVKTVQKAAAIARQAGSRLYPDSASSDRLLTGYAHDSVHHTQKEYARGDVHENRAECLFSWLNPDLRVFRGISKTKLPGYVGCCQFLRNFHQLTALEQAERILHAALDPAMASRAKKGDCVKCLDHFDLLQTAIN